MFRRMHKIIKRCLLSSSSRRWIQSFFQRQISRDVGQPTSYSHPELLASDEILPGISKMEFAHRRKRLMELISKTHSGMTNPNHLVIIPAASLRYMSNDVFYRFHQNNDFLYLTGFQEADSVLLIESNITHQLPDHKTVLYVTPRNPIKERWEGPLMGPDDAVDFLGVDEAYNMNLLSEHLEEKYSRSNYSVWYYGESEIPRIVSDSVDVIVSQHMIEAPGTKITSLHSIIHHLQHLRAIKSDAEIGLMKKAGQIAAESFKKVIPLTKPEMYEYELEAKFEYYCRIQGAQRLSFVPVVAGGHRGCHLHYTTNEQKLKNGHLVLMDAGAEYYGYVSDITRTWPVNGKFTTGQQELYEAILRVKEACIEHCRPGITLNYLHSISKELIAAELKVLGILPMRLEGSGLIAVLNSLFPHDLGHYLGMDVHDCSLLNHNVPLVPGMVITVEPGVYIHREFPIQDPVKAREFQGLAIRIEDNVLITKKGADVLNAGTPQTIDEITTLMN